MILFKRTYKLIATYNKVLTKLQMISDGLEAVSGIENNFEAEMRESSDNITLTSKTSNSGVKLFYTIKLMESDKFAWMQISVKPAFVSVLSFFAVLVLTGFATYYKGFLAFIFPLEGLYAYFIFVTVSQKVHEIGLMLDPLYFNSPIEQSRKIGSTFNSLADLTIVLFIIGILYTIGFFTYIFINIF